MSVSLSRLKCFSKRDKNIRFNILCLGAIAAKMPYPLLYLFLMAILLVPSNKFFLRLRNIYYKYSIENKIFKVNKCVVNATDVTTNWAKKYEN